MNNFYKKLIIDLVDTPKSFALLIIVLIALVIVLDAITSVAKKKRLKTGLKESGIFETAFGSKPLPVKTYVSDMQGLSGRPDGLISENGFIIPIERKAFSKKVRDRYIAQLLVYMRLVEEFEGKKPPYGYLVLGKKNRLVKIYNNDDKQAWLSGLLGEMKSFVNESVDVKATPHKNKCKKCIVREDCEFREG